MKIISLIKTVFDLVSGFILSKIVPAQGEIYLVGSNYGNRTDPNAEQVRDELLKQKKIVFRVANTVQYSSTLRRGTVRVAYYFFSSKACFYTHSLSDLLPHAHKLSSFKRFFRFPKLVFLQHGVIGLKSTLSNGVSLRDYIRSLQPTFDYMIVSSIAERKIIENFGVPSEQIAITGLPRFDCYHNHKQVEKSVLVFFTWQHESRLQQKFAVIEKSGVFDLLAAQGYSIFGIPHNMQRLSSSIPGLTDLDDQQLQSKVASSALLITDDSSVAWDFLYRGQEVIFLAPSEDWLTSDPHLLGRRCNSEQNLTAMVENFLSEPDINHAPVFVDQHDNKNTERVLALVCQQGNDSP